MQRIFELNKIKYILGIGISITFFLIILNLSIFEMQSPSEDPLSKNKLINSLLVIKSGLNELYLKESDYSSVFGVDNASSFSLKNVEKILLDNEIIIKSINQPYLKKFVLKTLTKECFVFSMDLNLINSNDAEKVRYLKDMFGRQYFNSPNKCNIKNCYIFFTEKGILGVNDIYNCKKN